MMLTAVLGIHQRLVTLLDDDDDGDSSFMLSPRKTKSAGTVSLYYTAWCFRFSVLATCVVGNRALSHRFTNLLGVVFR